MTGDARADADAQADRDVQANTDAQANENAGEREYERERDESEPSERERNEPESRLTRTETRMSEANTDTERPAESSTDLAIRRNLYRAALALFALLAVVAVIQLYGSVNSAINTFVAREYRPLFRAAFNLVVLLASGIGISWCVRELTGE